MVQSLLAVCKTRLAWKCVWNIMTSGVIRNGSQGYDSSRIIPDHNRIITNEWIDYSILPYIVFS